MVLRPDRQDVARAIFAKWELDFAVIGHLTDTGRITVRHKGGVEADIPLAPLADQAPLDRAINDSLVAGWPLTRIDSVMRATLRGGAYELKKRRDIPARVVIKEYVDVGGAFFGREESGMINAVLDELARSFRAKEFEQAAP